MNEWIFSTVASPKFRQFSVATLFAKQDRTFTRGKLISNTLRNKQNLSKGSTTSSIKKKCSNTKKISRLPLTRNSKTRQPKCITCSVQKTHLVYSVLLEKKCYLWTISLSQKVKSRRMGNKQGTLQRLSHYFQEQRHLLRALCQLLFPLPKVLGGDSHDLTTTRKSFIKFSKNE